MNPDTMTNVYRSLSVALLCIIGWFSRNAYFDLKEGQERLEQKFDAYEQRDRTEDKATAEKIFKCETTVSVHEVKITQIQADHDEEKKRRNRREPEVN